MSLRSDISTYGRLARGLASFLRNPVSIDDARLAIRRRLEQRDALFLNMVERTVFGYAASPYRPLLAMAGVEFGDISRLVRSDGIESTLRALQKAGVFVTFEEFKGRAPLVRQGRHIEVDPSAFDNPFLRHHYETRTGGSSGPGARSTTDLGHLAVQATHLAVGWQAHGLSGAPKAAWRGLLPDGSGINSVLASARAGEVFHRWFSPVRQANLTSSRKYALATYGIVAMGRLSGVPLPWPTSVPFERADIVARWAADAVRRYGRCYVSTSASLSVRVSVAAREQGLDLRGVTFSGGGEPLTTAKADEIARAGAQCRPSYYSTETGAIGTSCGHPIDAGDLHLFKDAIAIVQHARLVPGSAQTVDAFLVTSLLPSAPKLLLNVELDDYGVIERRACGCALEELGLTEHIRHVRSFRKLTGEGVTLIGTDMVRILEEVLPTRFGGTGLDYQLLEEEGTHGLTRLCLLVSPRIVIADEHAVIEAVLQALSKSGVGPDHASAIWRQAGTLQVKRAEPMWTGRGKLMPLHLASRGRSIAHTSGVNVPSHDHGDHAEDAQVSSSRGRR